MLGSMASGAYTTAFDDAIRGTAAEEYLSGKAREVQGQGLRVNWETQSGLVAESILDVAQKHAANLIVMSTHGRSGVGRWVMGSVADRVLRASQIPVLLIRSGAVVQ